MRVLVFGYSENTDRFSNRAAKLLKDYNHEVVTINPRQVEEFERINTNYDTLTLYVNPVVGDKFADMLVKSKPKRVIFNPGTENDELEKIALANGIKTMEACTLVLLSTNQY